MVKRREALIAAMRSANALIPHPAAGRGKGLVRILVLLIAGAAIAAVAGAFGIARDYGYLRASILTGEPGGAYHELGTRLADRAKRERGNLTVIPTAGSLENVRRLAAQQGRCAEMFGLVQDGTPVPAEAGLETLGRLPEPESLILLARRGNAFNTFADLRGASIGIGPEGSGTANLMRRLFASPDLQGLSVRLSPYELHEQAALVAAGKLDLAAFVTREDSDFLRTIIHQHALDIVSPRDLEGLLARFPWVDLGRIPAGRYDVVNLTPATDKQVAQLATLVVVNACARRADRVALLMLLGAELPGFVHHNPPTTTASVTVLPLAPSARQFFLTGQPELADRYFPWLVNLMSPAYWVYLVMAVTILFNLMKAVSRFRLWRIDAAREKLETALRELVDPGLTHPHVRAAPGERVIVAPESRAAAEAILARLWELRARAERYTSSFATPMGDEMFYRYQQSLIDDATTTVSLLLRRAPGAAAAQAADVHQIGARAGSVFSPDK